MNVARAGLGTDLSDAALAASLGERPVRSYPALLSTEATAMAWARDGAPDGALVVADYQASPRGRAGLPWQTEPGRGLGCTLITRPELGSPREGWPYVAALLALLDVTDRAGAGITWPDTVHGPDGQTLAALGCYAELGRAGIEWVVITVLVEPVPSPRATSLAGLVAALERRLSQPAGEVLAAYTPRCTTLGQQVRARLIPMGPGGPEVNGEAVDVLADGALVVRTERGSRVAVPPQNLGLLEPPAPPDEPPTRLFGQRD